MSELVNSQPIDVSIERMKTEVPTQGIVSERKKRTSFQDWLEGRREPRSEDEEPPRTFHFFEELKRSLGIGVGIDGEQPHEKSEVDQANKLDTLPTQDKYLFFAEVAERFRAAGSRLLSVTSLTGEVTHEDQEELHTDQQTDRYGIGLIADSSTKESHFPTNEVDRLRPEHVEYKVTNATDLSPIEGSVTPREPKQSKKTLRAVLGAGIASALWSRDPYTRLERRTRQNSRNIRKVPSENRALKKEVRALKRLHRNLPATRNVSALPTVEAKIAVIVDARVSRPVVERKEDPKSYVTREEVPEVVRRQRTTEATIVKKYTHEIVNKPRISPEVETVNTEVYMQTVHDGAFVERKQEPLVRANQYVSGSVSAEKLHTMSVGTTNSVQFIDDKNTTLRLLKTLKNTAQQKTQSEPWIATVTVVILLAILNIIIIT